MKLRATGNDIIELFSAVKLTINRNIFHIFSS